MAARLRARHQEEVKEKIRASQLINFLQNHALEGSEANASRVDAAKFLLNKIIANPPAETVLSNPDGSNLFDGISVSLVNAQRRDT